MLHPKDVPSLQFTSIAERKGKILPEVEISMVNVMSKQKVDVPNLQFNLKTERKGKISPEVEISMVNVMSKQKVTSSTDIVEKGGEISPQSQKFAEKPVINLDNEYIVEYIEDPKNQEQSLLLSYPWESGNSNALLLD